MAERDLEAGDRLAAGGDLDGAAEAYRTAAEDGAAHAGTKSGSDTALSLFGGQQNLHSQNYGAAIDNQGNADCEVGQRGYPQKLTSDPAGRQIVTDVHTPGNQGPTFAGLSRVPPGETFSRAPTTGPTTG
jgi:hypothetical protein